MSFFSFPSAMVLPVLCSLIFGHVNAAESVRVSLAGLHLGKGNDGKVQVRTGGSAFEEVQLSLRYFTDPIVIKGQRTVDLYSSGDDPAKDRPSASVRLPEGGKHFLVVLSQKKDVKMGQVSYRAKVVAADEWPQGSLFLVNATSAKIGMMLGNKPQILNKNATTVLKGENPARSIPVKMMVADQKRGGKSKLIFSSTWRISPHRREFCVLYHHGNKIKLRSLLERSIPQSKSDKKISLKKY